jgi:hypothetical protein
MNKISAAVEVLAKYTFTHPLTHQQKVAAAEGKGSVFLKNT